MSSRPSALFSTFSRSFCSFVYDSQSGRKMIIPGSQGIRLHLCEAVGDHAVESWLAAAADVQQKAQPKAQLVSFDCRINLLPAQLGLNLTPVVPISSLHELEDLARARDSKDRSLSNLTPEISTILGAKRGATDSDRKAAVSLIKSSVEMGFAPRAIIKSAWKRSSNDDDDDDENLHQMSLSMACVEMADAGSYVVCFSDDLDQVSGESLRSAVEEAFGMDVLGEGMMERLSVRLFKRRQLIRRAKELGVTRFDIADHSMLGHVLDLL